MNSRMFDRAGLLMLAVILGAASLGSLVEERSARAAGASYGNDAIADKALSYLHRSGSAACQEAGKPGGEQCKQFVNCIVYMVSGHAQYPVDPYGNYQQSYPRVGGREVWAAGAVKGDIIQYGSVDGDAASGRLHTAIVVENKGGGLFSVVDANARHDAIVRQHDYRPPDGSRFWRMGAAADRDFVGIPPDGMIVENENATHWYVSFGGSLIWFDRSDAAVRESLLAERDRRFGWMNTPRMLDDQIRTIEYGFGGNRVHVPADNSFFYEAGSLQQYVVQYRYAFGVGTAEEVAYLGGVDRAVMVPPGLASKLTGIPEVPNDVILKAVDNPTYHHVVHGRLYAADNSTVIGCIETVKNGRHQPVPNSILQLFDASGRISGQPTSCEFPHNWALYGPGGVERWKVVGAHSYTRHRYADTAALHCWLGSEPIQVQLPDVAGINQPFEAEPLGCQDAPQG